MTGPLNGSQWRYCAKVGIAAALGYALAQGLQNQYAIYGAFTAALIVGTSVGEDLATSGNRVKGTLVGMLAGMVAATLLGPSFLSVGGVTAFTAFIALAFGWGVPVARIGVTIAIITLAVHSVNAVEYDLLRALNTLIGIVAGLAVTFFVWPIRGRAELERTMNEVLSVSRKVLQGLARRDPHLRPLLGKLHDSVAAVVKAGRDAEREWRSGWPPDVEERRVLEVLRLGADVLAAALAEPPLDTIQALERRIAQLAPDAR